MRNLFWGCIAALLFRWTWLRNKIVDNALGHPMNVQLIGYMGRWWVIKRRWWLPFHVRLHMIHRADRSSDLHNHPGAFRTFVLRGWYIEFREDGKFYARCKGDTAVMPAGAFHTISEVAPEGCMTLVIAYGWAKNRGKWGFKSEDGTFTPHEEYHGPR